MTLADLKTVVAAYLNKTPQDFVKGSYDLILGAFDNAARVLERLHDFHCQRVVATIQMNGAAGGTLSSAVLRGTSTAVKLKEITSFYKALSDGDVPLNHTPKKNFTARARAGIDQEPSNALLFRYPSDPETDLREYVSTAQEVILHGDTVTMQPVFTGTLVIDGVKFFDSFAVSPSAWLLEYGHDYLQWAAICELNFLTATFVNGLDGSMGPPTKQRDAAMQSLISYDASRDEAGRTTNYIL